MYEEKTREDGQETHEVGTIRKCEEGQYLRYLVVVENVSF